MTFDEKLGFPAGNHKMIYKFIKDLIKKDLIGMDWKHLLRTKTS